METSSWERVLEQWHPDPRGVRPLVDARSTALQLAPAAVVLLAALALRAPAPILLLISAFALLWIYAVAAAGKKQVREALSSDVSFELTNERVRIRMGGARRELELSEIDSIDVVAVPGSTPLGHVVLQKRGVAAMPPAIPSGRRVTSSGAGPVLWTTVELVDPREQLADGALTLWFVPNPEQVRSRIEAAARGLSPHARGPHR